MDGTQILILGLGLQASPNNSFKPEPLSSSF